MLIEAKRNIGKLPFGGLFVFTKNYIIKISLLIFSKQPASTPFSNKNFIAFFPSSPNSTE